MTAASGLRVRAPISAKRSGMRPSSASPLGRPSAPPSPTPAPQPPPLTLSRSKAPRLHVSEGEEHVDQLLDGVHRDGAGLDHGGVPDVALPRQGRRVRGGGAATGGRPPPPQHHHSPRRGGAPHHPPAPPP